MLTILGTEFSLIKPSKCYSQRPTGIAALPVNPNLVNTPIEISTMNVEGYRKNLPVPEFVADPGGIYEDAPEGDRSLMPDGYSQIFRSYVFVPSA